MEGKWCKCSVSTSHCCCPFCAYNCGHIIRNKRWQWLFVVILNHSTPPFSVYPFQVIDNMNEQALSPLNLYSHVWHQREGSGDWGFKNRNFRLDATTIQTISLEVGSSFRSQTCMYRFLKHASFIGLRTLAHRRMSKMPQRRPQFHIWSIEQATVQSIVCLYSL